MHTHKAGGEETLANLRCIEMTRVDSIFSCVYMDSERRSTMKGMHAGLVCSRPGPSIMYTASKMLPSSSRLQTSVAVVMVVMASRLASQNRYILQAANAAFDRLATKNAICKKRSMVMKIMEPNRGVSAGENHRKELSFRSTFDKASISSP